MIARPLLTEKEIASLLFAAPASDVAISTRYQRQAGFGGQPAAVKGSGMDFADLRAYQAGDDPRGIDWRATARSSHPLQRTFNADMGRPVYLVIDRRASMRFGTRRRLKVTQAVRAALWLGGREARAGNDIAAVILDSPCQWLPRGQGMTGIKRLANTAVAPCPPVAPDEHEPGWRMILAGLQQRLPRGSTVLVFSDFLDLGVEDVRMLRALGQCCETVAVRISDPLEMQAQLPGEVEYRWGQRLLRMGVATGKPSRWFARQQQQYTDFLVSEFARAGIVFRQLGSDQDELEDVLQ